VSTASKSNVRDLLAQRESYAVAAGLLAGLDHPTRRKIYEHLRRLPGDHFRSVARSLRLAVGTARYHLDALIREGIVYREDINGRARYFLKAGEVEKNRLYVSHWRYREMRLRVLFAIRRLENARPAAIGKALGISRQLAAYHLARLEDAGHIRPGRSRKKPE